MRLPYGGGHAGRAHPSCNTSGSHTDLTNMTAAREGQVAVPLTVPLTGIEASSKNDNRTRPLRSSC